MELNDKLWEYLKKNIPNFEKTTKRGQFLFTCPKTKEHKYASSSPTCTTIPGSDKFYCLQCSWKGNLYDMIRTIEKKDMTDSEVISFLTNNLKLDTYGELEEYKKYNWSLTPIAKNGKNPLEKDWTNKTHYDKTEWIKWLEQGLNLGLRTGEINKITVIDVDLKIAPTIELEEIYKDLNAVKTLAQNTPHGKHFIFKYNKELAQTVKLGNLTIDIRNDGGQIVVQPSKINNLSYSWINLGTEIKDIPENVKAKLLSLNKVDRGRNSEMSTEMTEQIEQTKSIPEGNRNQFLTSLGGVFINSLSPEQTEFVLNIINQKFMSPPLPSFEIKAMLGSLTGYKQTEEQTQEQAIYECLKLLQTDVGAKDVMEHTGLKRAIIDKYLAKFVKEGKTSRRGRGRYDLKLKVEWTNETPATQTECKYKIPYFDDIGYFHSGDIVLIGGRTGEGKTHIAMNIIKQMKDQGVIPFYISLESGSRHEKVAQSLNLTQKDYYISKEAIENPLQMEIEPNAFTIIDWLYTGEDFAATQSIFKYLSDEMKRKGGVLVVFTQLKENYDWFAVNLIKSFARLAARFVYDDTTGVASHFQVDKITDPKGHYSTATVVCEFNFDSKELIKKNNI